MEIVFLKSPRVKSFHHWSKFYWPLQIHSKCQADEVLQSSQLTRLQLLAIPYYAQLFVHTEQSDMTPRPKQAGSDLNFGKHTASNIGWMNDFIETFYKLPMVHNGEGKYNWRSDGRWAVRMTHKKEAISICCTEPSLASDKWIHDIPFWFPM